MDIHTEPKPFIKIFIKTLIYVVLSFIIIWSLLVINEEYSIYSDVPPPIPVIVPETPAPLTQAQKMNIANDLNLSTDKVYNPTDAARQLNSIPKPKNTMTDEEKNKILMGLE